MSGKASLEQVSRKGETPNYTDFHKDSKALIRERNGTLS
jgi:hypothetical protein